MVLLNASFASTAPAAIAFGVSGRRRWRRFSASLRLREVCCSIQFFSVVTLGFVLLFMILLTCHSFILFMHDNDDGSCIILCLVHVQIKSAETAFLCSKDAMGDDMVPIGRTYPCAKFCCTLQTVPKQALRCDVLGMKL